MPFPRTYCHWPPWQSANAGASNLPNSEHKKMEQLRSKFRSRNEESWNWKASFAKTKNGMAHCFVNASMTQFISKTDIWWCLKKYRGDTA